MTWARVGARRVGVLLMLLALAGVIVFARSTTARAEEAALTIDSQALYAFAPTDALPRLLVSEVPPGVICVVEPTVCPEELDPITKQLLTPLLGELLADAEPLPVELVPPGEIAVSLFAGSHRYMSAIKFALPAVPPGEQVDSFVITFDESQPTYGLSSPLFRQMVLAAVAQVGDTDSAPDIFLEELQKGLANEDDRFPPVDPSTRLGVEVCPLTARFKPSTLLFADSDKDIPRDASGEFAVDCLRGANGAYDEVAGTWSFDLTLAAQAWADGTLPNHGVLFRNQDAENLAFGDPDLSSFFQTVLAAGTGVSMIESSEPPPPLEPLPPPADGGAFGDPPVTTPPLGGTITPPITGTPEQPEVVDDGPVATDTPTAPVAAQIETPWWWLVLMLMVFLAGWYLTQWSLNAEPATTAARDGALARLTSRSPAPPDMPTQV